MKILLDDTEIMKAIIFYYNQVLCKDTKPGKVKGLKWDFNIEYTAYNKVKMIDKTVALEFEDET